MSNGFLKGAQKWQRLYRSMVTALLTSSSLASQCWFVQTAQAQTPGYCWLPNEAIAQKQTLLIGTIKGDSDSENRYRALIKQHAEFLRQCRERTWPNVQAIWLRLYPCDARAGAIDEILDRLVSRGYNQVNVEVFSDSQVLLPTSDNPTPWSSLIRTPGTERLDLLAQIIQKGRERGLRVYAWMFAMNFGYTYSLRPERQGVIARNGRGQTSLDVVKDGAQLFIDPYNEQAKTDYYQLIQAILKRRPDGVLFDYIRYPRGEGNDSVAAKVQDLWIYSEAAKQALYNRASNNQGRYLIERYISQGSISASDVEAVKKLYPNEATPLWQGRTPSSTDTVSSLQGQLWQLSVAHAAQGVIDFLSLAALAAQRSGVKAGAVFFPDGNQAVGNGGYDSRLQAWDRFPASIEWHAMSYGVCGNTSCIENLVNRVVERTPAGTQVTPAFAGTWGQSVSNRPPLEVQMQALRQTQPQINSVSHFAYSWQDSVYDRDRKFCQLR
jgi:hypothetical protein